MKLNGTLLRKVTGQYYTRNFSSTQTQQNHTRKHKPRKTKGRYSIVVFDSYGTVTLDNKQLQITQQKKETITEQPYQYLKEFVNRYYDDIEDQTLQELPFISGFIGSCSFDLVRHEFPVLKQMEN